LGGQSGIAGLLKKLPGLRKLPESSEPKPVLAKAFFITGEKTPPKERFRTHEAIVIKHFDKFEPHTLQPFLDQIRRAKANGGAK
jgi:hypothetical protein